ncbi:hypothetical protein RUM43_012755 [Polyplax serrata]|uniref:Uncharacterized protein n=1 Tax=Polyplax serrata TaxID=468196 RepID=A0AAN8S425_POLSC
MKLAVRPTKKTQNVQEGQQEKICQRQKQRTGCREEKTRLAVSKEKIQEFINAKGKKDEKEEKILGERTKANWTKQAQALKAAVVF